MTEAAAATTAAPSTAPNVVVRERPAHGTSNTPSPGLAARDARKAAARANAVAILGKATGKVDSTETADAEEPDTLTSVVEARTEAAPPAKTPTQLAREEADRRFFENARNLEEKRKARLAEEKRKADAEREEADRARARQTHDEDFKRLELAKKDPIKFLEAMGVTAKQLVERGITEGSPEAMAAAKAAALESELSDLKKWKEDFLRENEVKTKAQQEAAQKAEMARVASEKRREVIQILDTAHETVPALTKLSLIAGDEAVIARVFRVARDYYAETGEHPDMGALMKWVDKEVATEQASRAGSRQGAVSGSTAAAAAPPAKAAGRPKTTSPGHQSTPAPQGKSAREIRKEKAMAELRARRT